MSAFVLDDIQVKPPATEAVNGNETLVVVELKTKIIDLHRMERFPIDHNQSNYSDQSQEKQTAPLTNQNASMCLARAGSMCKQNTEGKTVITFEVHLKTAAHL